MTVNVADTHINYQRIEKAIQYLEQNFRRQPELDEVADAVHLSPFHFQRIFSEWAGISPKKFLQFLTVDYLKERLRSSKNLAEAAAVAGLSSQSRVYDLFTTLEGVTPQEYKLKGSGIRITYGFHDTPFGICLLGATDRGICWLSFLAADQDQLRELELMQQHWHHSTLQQDQQLTASKVEQIFSRDRKNASTRLHALVKGTNFQLKVWEALLRIPMGDVTTYRDIAATIQHPKAQQAVGSAVGANHIAYLIPCHRVIRRDGILGAYRWTAARKKSMIGWEFAQFGALSTRTTSLK